jgi:hypothetical protein
MRYPIYVHVPAGILALAAILSAFGAVAADPTKPAAAQPSGQKSAGKKSHEPAASVPWTALLPAAAPTGKKAPDHANPSDLVRRIGDSLTTARRVSDLAMQLGKAVALFESLNDFGKQLPAVHPRSVKVFSGNKTDVLAKNEAMLLSGNRPRLLSGNAPNALSGNQTPILSGNRLTYYSNLQFDIQISNSCNNSEDDGVPSPK